MPEKKTSTKFLCVIGASAGGLDAITKFLKNLPQVDEQLAIIIAQHLSPTHKSRLVELLQKNTDWPIEEAKSNRKLKYGKILITPPDKDISIERDKVMLTKPASIIGPKPSVNYLFASAAENSKERTIGVILSGSGSDGAAGIESIKMAGGTTLVQEPTEAAYDGMPNAAIESGMVDKVFSVESDKNLLEDIIQGKYEFKEDDDQTALSDFQRVVAFLAKRSGVDFSDYKENSIRRRLKSRMGQLKINSIRTYLDKLEKKPAELDMLFNHVLIGVTQFFRDAHSFEVLKEHLMDVIETKAEKSIRVWVAGCATGEEPVSIAILLHELLGKHFNEYNIQIFATDIDEKAISKARKGLFEKETVELLPPHYVDQYFEVAGNQFQLKKALRSCILFSRHDVTKNPPFLRLDMVVCRNLLIYFNAELQKRAIQTFHYGLQPHGLLFIGKSEALGPKEPLFHVLDKKHKIFRKKEVSRGQGLSFKSSSFENTKSAQKSTTPQSSVIDRIRATFSDAYHQTYLIIDESQEVLYMSEGSGEFLAFGKGIATNNLFKLIKEDYEIIIRAVVTRAIKKEETVISEVKRIVKGTEQFLVRIIVHPSLQINQPAYYVIFEKIPVTDALVPLSITKKEKQSVAFKELQQELEDTKEHLQTYIEELETTNEEMQSLNEELQSANEELQSSNEELETSNEELQSTNEEVQIAYQELKKLNEELQQKDDALRKVFDNVKALIKNELQGFVLINDRLNIVEYNEQALKILSNIGSKPLQKGRHFVDLLPERLSTLFFQFVKFTGDAQPVNTTINFPTANGEGDMVYLKLNFTSVISDAGVQNISIGLLDVTNETIAEQKLNRLNHELKLSNHDLEHFAKVTSHDLQEPIRAIKGFADLLQKSEKIEDQKIKDQLATIYQNTESLSKMVENLLIFANTNPKEKDKELLKASHCIALVKANLKLLIDQKHAEVVELCEMPEVFAVKSMIINVFQILIKNGLIHNAAKKPKVVVNCKEQEDHVEFAIQDNGIGIGKDQESAVFDLFSRKRNIDKNAYGVGLAIAKRAIERHGGKIWYESDGKTGTCFYFTLPKNQSA